MDQKCSSCSAPFHPATGHSFSDKTQICHRCAGHFWAWVLKHTSSKGGSKRSRVVKTKQSFYEAAATSVRAA